MDSETLPESAGFKENCFEIPARLKILRSVQEQRCWMRSGHYYVELAA